MWGGISKTLLLALFFSSFLQRGTGGYLAFKKNSVEPNEGCILASLYKRLSGNILFTSFQLILP